MFERTFDFLRRRRARRRLEQRGLIQAHRTRRHGAESELVRAADRSLVLGCFMLVLIWGVSSLLLTLSSSHRELLEQLVLDQRAPRTVNAAFDFTYEDAAATARARREAQKSEPLFYRISEPDNQRIQRDFEQFFNAVSSRNAASSAAPAAGRPADSDALPVRLAAGLNADELRVIEQCRRNPSAFRYFEGELSSLLSGGFLGSADKAALQVGQKLRVIDVRSRARLPRSVGEQPSDREAADALAGALLKLAPADAARPRLLRDVTAVCRALLGGAGNLVFDRERTDAGRQAAAEKVGAVTREVKKHHPIVTKDQVVDPETLARLELYERECALRDAGNGDWQQSVRNMFWSMTLVIMAGFYLYHIHPEVVGSNRRIAIVGIAVLISLVCNYGGIQLFALLAGESRSLSPSLVIDAVPLALIAVLMAAFLGFRVAICTGFFVASVTALMLDLSFEFVMKGMLICALPALAVRQATNYRSFFLRTVVSVFPLVWLLNINVIGSVTNLHAAGVMVIQSGGMALANAMTTAILALMLIFAFELLLNVTTNMSLMVLCDYNHPLLERMKREAPGTFFHSLMVATLAEDAARAIGANYLRAKAGALFHDIGKLAKPQYFTENNQNGNLHADLTPQMSSIIIRDHVKEGLELAQMYRLPRVVRETIAQHHGNDLVQYFYRKAREQARPNDPEVSEAQFRYAGTPPEGKECAIVSLADACEAACRSLDKPSATRIEAQVDEIFQHRFQDGLLSRADMTLAELETVRESFINTLLSMKHGRVSYQLGTHREAAAGGAGA